MTTEGFQRKLTAILSADVKEYSRLMRDDEDATIRTLTTYRSAIAKLVQQYRGRVVDSPGDNVLAEFGSVVDAVNCAVEIQRELAERNAELPYHRRMEFRIGINSGDVVEEGERIYGDGVNIAARVEGLAEGGGICMSGTVYDSIEGKLGLEFEYLGEHEVKNIDKPLRVYRVLSFPGAAAHRVVKAKTATERKWRNVALAIVALVVLGGGALAIWDLFLRPAPPSVEPASVEKMAFPLPDKPSIAVLPFVNMSGDPEQEYIADGITENIITALSKVPQMFVIARTSTFTYKGKPVKVKQVSEELGVRYVLEGSFQKEGDRVRITAQLVDAIKGHHLWAERYDRDIKHFFDLLDEMTKEIGTALQVQLTWGDYARNIASTDNFDVWAHFTQGYSHFLRFKRRDNDKARELCERALKLDPAYVPAWRLIAHTHLLDVRLGWSKSPRQSMKRAEELAQKALTIDESDAGVHALLGYIYLMKRQYEKAIIEGERAITLAPNFPIGYLLLAETMHFSGRFDESIAMIKTAMRLHGPYYPAYYLTILGGSYHWVGRYEEALAAHKELLERSLKGESPEFIARYLLIAVKISLGQVEEARKDADEVLRLDPKFSLEYVRKVSLYKDPSHLEKLLDALRKAGLPETPPLPLPDKPSIAVLPFVNMSGDPEQEYFSDGITEEIITALSKVPRLFVIARNSTFTYKGKPVKVQRVGRELGVRYVLEGSVRKEAGRVRITAQLVEATTGHHLWAERYERDLKDIFTLQDEITMKIVTAMQVKLTEGEQARLVAKGTKNLEAYLKLLQGLEPHGRGNKEENARAQKLYEEAIALDPEYANAYALLGITHLMDVWYGSSKSPMESFAQAMKLAQKAIAIDASLANAHGLLGYIYTITRRYDMGIAQCERAVAINPNDALAQEWLGHSLYWADRAEEALPVLKRAMRLAPISPSWGVLAVLAMAYRDMGRFEEAISACKRALKRWPDNFLAHMVLAATYSMSGREEEARSEAAEILKINPDFSLERFAQVRPHKSQENTARFVDALRKAGLK